MKIKYESSFKKDLSTIKDKKLLKKVKEIIEKIKNANNISDLNKLKKLKGYETFYRIRVADYRIGLEVVEKTEIILVRILHRKDVYRYFP